MTDGSERPIRKVVIRIAAPSLDGTLHPGGSCDHKHEVTAIRMGDIHGKFHGFHAQVLQAAEVKRSGDPGGVAVGDGQIQGLGGRD